MASTRSEILAELDALLESANSYFDRAAAGFYDADDQGWFDPEPFWPKLPEPLRDESVELIGRLIPLGKRVAGVCKNSLLVTDADMRELTVEVKRLRAALLLRKFHFQEADAIHDEGMVLGFRPATQSEFSTLSPNSAKRVFQSSFAELMRIVQLADDEPGEQADGLARPGEIGRYRPNTAFIMMWMDPSQHDLVDVRDAVRDTFAKFDIRAVRADEIEHEGVITQRIIDEIRTAEFLFADLTGTRPNVYYEIGYAHALGKRVILYRKHGTGLHFDLAGYNCPEYVNLHDLKDKLTRRLETLTNRTARNDEG